MGWGVRNFLAGDAWARLQETFDLLILSVYADVPGFRERFEEPGVTVHPLGSPTDNGPTKIIRGLTRVSYWYRVKTGSHQYKLSSLRSRLRARAGRKGHIAVRRKRKKTKITAPAAAPPSSALRRLLWATSYPVRVVYEAIGRRYRPRRSIRRVARRWKNRGLLITLDLLRWVGPPLFPLLKPICRRLLGNSPHVRELRELLRREGVCGLFSTNCCSQTEWPAVLAAQALRLPVVGAVTSWDNPSSKGLMICKYDALLAWTRQMEGDIRKYMNGSGKQEIHVTGPPQFDYYLQPAYQRDRETFCAELGIDPAKKIVCYSTVSPGIMPDDPEMVCRVADILRKIPLDTQLLVRLHPMDRMQRYKKVRRKKRYNGIIWTLAGEPKLRTNDQWCPDREDLIRAGATIRHSDVNVHCSYSTMMLDFSALDKPVVVIGHDIDGSSERFRLYENYEHIRPVLDFGAVRVAYSTEDLGEHLSAALSDPRALAAERRALVRSLLGDLDGQAGLRCAGAIVEAMRRGIERHHERRAARQSN